MTLKSIVSPATVGGLLDALYGAMLDGKIAEDDPLTYVSITLEGSFKTAHVYVADKNVSPT